MVSPILSSVPGAVKFSDGAVWFFEYITKDTNGTVISHIHSTYGQMEDHWGNHSWLECDCLGEETVEVYADTKEQYYWEGKACRNCGSLRVPDQNMVLVDDEGDLDWWKNLDFSADGRDSIQNTNDGCMMVDFETAGIDMYSALAAANPGYTRAQIKSLLFARAYGSNGPGLKPVQLKNMPVMTPEIQKKVQESMKAINAAMTGVGIAAKATAGMYGSALADWSKIFTIKTDNT